MKIKFVAFSITSVLTIFSIIFYVYKFIKEKQIIFTMKDQFFVYLFAIIMVSLLSIGITIGYFLYLLYKQNSKLLVENDCLIFKIERLEEFVKNLADQSNEEICSIIKDVEDNLVESIRENEDTIIHIMNNK